MIADNYPIVLVEWIDAAEEGDIGWNSLKEMLEVAAEPCPTMYSVGYKVYQDDEHVSLISTLNNEVSSSVDKIPVAWIRRMEILEPHQPKKVVPEKFVDLTDIERR